MATECRKRLPDPHERYFAGGDVAFGVTFFNKGSFQSVPRNENIANLFEQF